MTSGRACDRQSAVGRLIGSTRSAEFGGGGWIAAICEFCVNTGAASGASLRQLPAGGLFSGISCPDAGVTKNVGQIKSAASSPARDLPGRFVFLYRKEVMCRNRQV